MHLGSLVFCLYLAFATNIVVEALNSSEPGVCEVTISERKTRVKLVTLNKKCGKKKCVVKKTETYTTPEKRLLCCKGWEYNAELDQCSPICSTGCEGGKCTAPEECTCYPPTYKDPNNRNICLHPKCNQPCVNGQCVANNTCQCDPETARINATHCMKCDNGYAVVENVCQPICKNDCQSNSYCSKPNVCTCKEGYVEVNSTCVLDCKCVNAKCVGPNICECSPGYSKQDDKTCKPMCDNCSGECIGPNICKCPDGFESGADGKCLPISEVTCVNGHFSGKHVCICDAGYMVNGTDPGVCVRNCNQPEIQTK